MSSVALAACADAEAERRQSRAPVLLDPDGARDEARAEATRALSEQLAHHFRALHAER